MGLQILSISILIIILVDPLPSVTGQSNDCVSTVTGSESVTLNSLQDFILTPTNSCPQGYVRTITLLGIKSTDGTGFTVLTTPSRGASTYYTSISTSAGSIVTCFYRSGAYYGASNGINVEISCMSTSSCNLRYDLTASCVLDPNLGQWSSGSWGSCSGPGACDGVQTRNVSCSASSCLDSAKPAVERACDNPACGTWNVQQWSECSIECGAGSQSAQVTCSTTQCSQTTKPASSRSCNTQQCNPWTVGDWGSCSADCGSGTQNRVVTCSAGSCLQASKPVSSQTCNTQQCPAVPITTGPRDCSLNAAGSDHACCNMAYQSKDGSVCTLKWDDGRCADSIYDQTFLFPMVCSRSSFSPCQLCGTSNSANTVDAAKYQERVDYMITFYNTNKCWDGQIAAYPGSDVKVLSKSQFETDVANSKCILRAAINGNYTQFGAWSECSKSCGSGVISRQRTCSAPSPQYGGNDCSSIGAALQTMPCNTQACDDSSSISMAIIIGAAAGGAALLISIIVAVFYCRRSKPKVQPPPMAIPMEKIPTQPLDQVVPINITPTQQQ